MKRNAANTDTYVGLSPTVDDPVMREWVAAAVHLVQLTATLACRGQEPPPPCPAARAKLAYSIDEAIEALSLGRTQLFDLLRRGEIVSVKIGRRRSIPAELLESYLARLIADQGPVGRRG